MPEFLNVAHYDSNVLMSLPTQFDYCISNVTNVMKANSISVSEEAWHVCKLW